MMKMEPGFYWYKGSFPSATDSSDGWEVLRVCDGYFQYMGSELDGSEEDLEWMKTQGQFIRIQAPD